MALRISVQEIAQVRAFSTCVHHMASSKVHRTRKQAYKKAEETQWKIQKSMNPFTRNVGAARSLNKLGIDADDPTFGDNMGNVMAEESLEEWRDQSKAFRKQYKADDELQKQMAKKKIIQKKMFGPKPASPVLLTWMEKEMIRYLHRKDPVDWSRERLADSFPATTGVIHKVLRSSTLLDEDRIDDYNKTVVSNWQLLSKGKLELEPRYEDHLKRWAGSDKLSLSPGEKYLAEQEIMTNLGQSLALPKPSVPGEFSSLIIDYNRKLEQKESKEKGMVAESSFDIQSLFGHNSIPGTPIPNEVSAFGETALLNTNIDLRKEKSMGIEKFRNIYLKESDRKKRQIDGEKNCLREKYMDWVKNESAKSKYVTKHVSNVDTNKILSEECRIPSFSIENNKRVTDKIDVEETESGQVFVFNSESGYKFPYTIPDNPDVIEISDHLKTKYKFFKMGDSLYDQDGELLFRVPGLD